MAYEANFNLNKTPREIPPDEALQEIPKSGKNKKVLILISVVLCLLLVSACALVLSMRQKSIDSQKIVPVPTPPPKASPSPTQDFTFQSDNDETCTDYTLTFDKGKIIVKAYKPENNPTKGTVDLVVGDVITTILKDVYVSGAGCNTISMAKTKDPNIIAVRNSDGDVGAFYINFYYVDLNTKKIITIIKTDQSYEFNLESGGKNLTLKKDIADKCGTGPSRVGKVAQLLDLNLNGAKANLIDVPQELNCLDSYTIGTIYDPEPVIELLGYDPTANIAQFLLKTAKLNDEGNIFEKKFKLDLNNSSITAI